MDLPQSYRQTLAAMPDMAFGEDKPDYSRRIVEWGRSQGVGSAECLRCAAIKWDAWEVAQLIGEIVDDRPDALKKAVVRLLRDRYLP